MDMRSGLDGLRSLLGVPQTATPAAPVRNSATAGTAAASSDRATLSQAASQASQIGDDVRTEKVAAIQAALASGTYSVPATAVASSMIDAMLAGAR
ncbi:MAG: flagellar biosynthesis anti-sigma factor FlgM [Acidobacteriota bacterium]